MFCAKCGKELPENAAFCPGCGLEQEIKKKRKLDLSFIQNLPKKTKLIAVGAAAALVLVLVVCFCLGGNSHYNTPEELALATMEATETYNVDQLVSVLPEWRLRKMKLQYGLPLTASEDELVTKMQLELGDMAEYLSIESNLSTGYRVYATKELDVLDLKWEKHGLTAEEYESISQVIRVGIEIGRDGYWDKHHVDCVEIDGCWYMWDLD